MLLGETGFIFFPPFTNSWWRAASGRAHSASALTIPVLFLRCLHHQLKKKKNSPMDKVKQSKHKQKKTHHCLSVSMGNWFQDLRWISDPKMVKSQWWITMLCAYSPHTSSCVLNCLFMPSILQCKCYPVELHCLERGDKTCWVEKAYIQSTVIWILSCRLSRSRGRQHIDPMGF